MLDPQLFMAARRGDVKRLKEHLLLLDEDAACTEESTAVASMEVIVEVDRRPAAAAAPAPVSAGSPLPLVHDVVTIDGDSLLHVVAACGDSDEFLDCARMIVAAVCGEKKHHAGTAARRLAVLEARNSKGDTALHCAAAAGNANMISCLVDLVAGTTAAADEVAAFLRKNNECGETALHQAVRATKNKVGCIDKLMAMDPELACIPTHEEGAASPLYLAISLGEMEIARHLLDASKGNLSFSGPHGQNVLHAAVSRGQALPMILDWLNREVAKTADMQQVGQMGRDKMSASVPSANHRPNLLSELTSQRDKQQNGSTPLHLAASLDGWDWDRYSGPGLLSKTIFREVWPGAAPAARLLLDANVSTAYQADNEGSYPIHAAAWSDSLAVVRLLLRRCPDCATLRDGKGRTFLHVAVCGGRDSVVKYVCETPDLASILNAQANNGDTALHCAVREGNLAVFNRLIRNRRVSLDVPNKDGMTPLDLSRITMPSAFGYALNPRKIVWWSLVLAGAPHGGGRPDLFREEHMPKRDDDKESRKITEATQVMSIVAVLVATVTFASAIMLPGGYRADGDDAGTPVLSGRYAFDAFFLADTLAFVCSCLATFSLVYAGVPAMDITTRIDYFDISAHLLQSAGRSFLAAFALGSYLLLAPVDHTTAVAVCVIIFASPLIGNREAWQLTGAANTVRARIGIRRFAVWLYARPLLILVFTHFGSHVAIFGLPAIRKWARSG